MDDDGRRSTDPGSDTRRAEALQSAFRILARRDHTCTELTVKLRGKGFGPDAVAHALNRCRELGYLDDAKTAWAIAGHLTERGYGPLRVRQTLLQKGVDEALVQKTLARCGDETSQVLRARRILEKKTARKHRETDVWKRRQAAYRYLAGRGYSSEIINRAIGDD